MPSRREFKRLINSELLDIIDSAYDYMEENPGEKVAEANAIIDGAVDILNDVSDRMSEHKKLEGKKVKAHFNTIQADVEKQAAALRAKIAKL